MKYDKRIHEGLRCSIKDQRGLHICICQRSGPQCGACGYRVEGEGKVLLPGEAVSVDLASIVRPSPPPSGIEI